MIRSPVAAARTMGRRAVRDPNRHKQASFAICDHATPVLYGEEQPGLTLRDGRSSGLELPYHWRIFGHDMASVAEHWNLRDAVGIGHSSGGHTTVQAAALRPLTYRALLLLDPTIFPPEYYGTEPLDAAFTLPVSLVVALDVALGLLLEEGLEAAFERHVRLGRAARAGVKAMGLELFSPDEDRSAVVTAVRPPDGIDAGDIVKALRERFGMTIAGGQGELQGKIFRLGHIGWFDVFDITTMLAAVELVLSELGADVERGVAVTAALEAYEHTRVA